jgi:hypothetical protein
LDVLCDLRIVIKFGGTRSAPPMDIGRQIWNLCLQTNTWTHLTYVASPCNAVDAPSRQLVEQVSWQHLGHLFMCPSWNLLPPILNKLQQKRVRATLITPWWLSAIWFPTLRKIARPRPLTVPRHFVLPAVGTFKAACTRIRTGG